ncbi:MAG: polyprenol phosphomannose-dependent alpha 1,6 mannosyltransferase MptB [Actinomycetota bacterium]|nr:polyprenol phosphomannose-dependent alpha 1,6 mannosyltransferase MptB [Actinomycetota bacterium]
MAHQGSGPDPTAGILARAAARARTSAVLPAGGRACVALALLGLGLSACVALATSRLQSAGARRLLGDWWTASSDLAGWLPTPRDSRLPLAAAVTGLTLCWLALGWLMRLRGTRPRVAATVAVCWAGPFAFLPPVLSRDVYAYLAQGDVIQRGWDPYRVPIAALGRHSVVLAATDPLWRHSIPPYGAIAVRLSSLAAFLGGSRPVLGLVALRVLAVLALALATWAATALVPSDRRTLVLWLVAASPLALLHAVGGAHWESVTCALVAVSLLLTVRGHGLAALVIAVAATELKVTAAVVVAALLVGTARNRGLRVSLVHAVAAGVVGLGIPLALGVDPWGWVRGLSTPAAVWNPLTPSTTVTMAALEGLERLGGGPVPSLLGALQVVSTVVAVVLALALLATSARRELVVTVGLLLAEVALFGPVLWPWYLIPAALCLFLSAEQWWRRVGMALTAGAVLFTLPISLVTMQRLAAANELTVLAALLLTELRRRRSARLAAEPGGAFELPAGSRVG